MSKARASSFWSHSSLVGALFALPLVACGAGADPVPGATGSGATGSGSGATGGSSAEGGSGGSSSGAGATTGTGATTGSGATGGSGTATGGTTGSGGTSAAGSANGGGSAGTGAPPPPVSLALPYTEDWESGSIDSNWWLPTDPTLLGSFAIVDAEMGKALEFTANGDVQLVGGDLAWTDIKLDVKVKIVSGDPTLVIGARFAGVKDFYYIELGNEHFKIRDRNGGASDVQSAADEPAMVTGQWHTVTFTVQGQNVTGALDGVDVATGTLSGAVPVANGGIGFGSRSGSGAVVLFDDIVVSAP